MKIILRVDIKTKRQLSNKNNKMMKKKQQQHQLQKPRNTNQQQRGTKAKSRTEEREVYVQCP